MPHPKKLRGNTWVWDKEEENIGSGLAEWLELLTANDNVAIVLGSNHAASSDTVESEARQRKQCLLKHINIQAKNGC
jgi:hypothetical protein